TPLLEMLDMSTKANLHFVVPRGRGRADRAGVRRRRVDGRLRTEPRSARDRRVHQSAGVELA
ncbi:MAG: hypothetical protein ACRDSN_03950, partial [Pseudonocardiaceae bacterium]